MTETFTPDANYLAVEIQRRFPSDQWAAHLASLPDDKREDAAKYLRDIWRREQFLRSLK